MTGFPFTINNSAQRAGLDLARCAFFEAVRIATTSDIGHWFRNDRFFARGAVCGGTHGSRPTAEHFVGQGPRALPGVRCKQGVGNGGFFAANFGFLLHLSLRILYFLI